MPCLYNNTFNDTLPGYAPGALGNRSEAPVAFRDSPFSSSASRAHRHGIVRAPPDQFPRPLLSHQSLHPFTHLAINIASPAAYSSPAPVGPFMFALCS